MPSTFTTLNLGVAITVPVAWVAGWNWTIHVVDAKITPLKPLRPEQMSETIELNCGWVPIPISGIKTDPEIVLNDGAPTFLALTLLLLVQPGAQRRISRWPGKQATGEGTQIQAGAPYNQDSFAAPHGILNRSQGVDVSLAYRDIPPE